MRVLLIGNLNFYHIGAFFKRALEALGYEHAYVDEGKFLQYNSLIHKAFYRLLNRRPLTYWALNREIIGTASDFLPDVVIVCKGAHISPRTLCRIKAEGRVVLVNYATDDPFNQVLNTPDLLASIPLYDFYACTKRAIMEDVRRAGCALVRYIPFGYEPSLHFPESPATENERALFSSDLVFVGASDADRIPIMKELATITGIEMHLHGGFWERDRILRRYYRGFVLARDYRLALGCSKIALGLVRRTNRDRHSMRTFEIPACGAFMLGERTEEHLELFEEDQEATYFSSNEELLDKVRYYLSHLAERERIAQAGYQRVISGSHTYRDRLIKILKCVKENF